MRKPETDPTVARLFHTLYDENGLCIIEVPQGGNMRMLAPSVVQNPASGPVVMFSSAGAREQA